MTLYETMFVRRSVRKYLPERLDAAQLDEIMDYVRGIPQLNGCRAKFRLIGPEEMGLNQAPHYIVASCAANSGEYANVGYVLEKADLYLQSIGLGSLWYGMRLPAKAQADDCIVIQFGKTEVPPRRDESGFNRLSLAKIADTDNSVTRTARLAPSAVNSQPWFIEWGEDTVKVHYHGRGLMKASLEKKLNKIDLGIVTRFIETALENEGKTVSDISASSSGRDFTITLRYRS